MGKIRSYWLGEEQKVEILVMIGQAKEKGLSITRTCTLWRINRRRVVRWRRKWKDGRQVHNLKPGPGIALHRLLPEEKRAVLQMATKEQYADSAHRILAVTGWDLGLFFVSFSSVYRILRAHNLMSMRGTHRSEPEVVLGYQLPPDL